jgi:hypothetical protein
MVKDGCGSNKNRELRLQFDVDCCGAGQKDGNRLMCAGNGRDVGGDRDFYLISI